MEIKISPDGSGGWEVDATVRKGDRVAHITFASADFTEAANVAVALAKEHVR